jgi:hypothetical protein
MAVAEKRLDELRVVPVRPRRVDERRDLLDQVVYPRLWLNGFETSEEVGAVSLMAEIHDAQRGPKIL